MEQHGILDKQEPFGEAVDISGEVSSGLGRAHIFMAQPHYQEQFKKVLGIGAWPGTLNVDLTGESLVRFAALRNAAGMESKELDERVRKEAAELDVSYIEAHRIHGFERDGRSFGGATAFLGYIAREDDEQNRLDCAVLIPDLTRHVAVMEVIAAAFLREALDLTDGDRVIVSCSVPASSSA
ncbi:MAG: CTP-dependent riboflavin kinase [Candidatus Poseidoniales archaeon]|nr:CTP-dependent riboflavin kinase [Candidatus Poseidoniales archaeon]